jgi:DNA-binding SARP family transcriptional activator
MQSSSDEQPAEPAVVFGILGPVEVRVDGGPQLVRGVNARRALGLLLVRLRKVVPAGLLIDAVWPDDAPANPVGALQVTMSRLRRDLGPAGEAIIARSPGYVLDAPPEALDAHRFVTVHKAAQARLSAGSAAEALAGFEQALGLWRGVALEDVRDVEPLAHEARWLDALRVTAEEHRVDCLLAMGRHGEAVDDLQPLIDTHPLRERFREQLLVGLYRCGRQADALHAYQDARSVTIDQLGTEPGPALQALHRQVLAHDPDLGVPDRRPRPPAIGAHTGAPARAPSRPHTLPATTGVLFGREDLLAEVTGHARTGALVTLTGTAGTGKSRLAAEVARRLADDWPEGPWRIDLAPATTPARVHRIIAGALDIAEHPGRTTAQAIREFLQRRAGLLVLDSCEHVAAAVADLLEPHAAHTRTTTVLATSQVPWAWTARPSSRCRPCARRTPPTPSTISSTTPPSSCSWTAPPPHSPASPSLTPTSNRSRRSAAPSTACPSHSSSPPPSYASPNPTPSPTA